MSHKRYGARERADKCLLDLQMACYHAVHDYPGGAVAIAAMAGMNAPVLQNKLNPNTTTHVVNLRDLQSICELTRDERILQTVCSYYNAAYFLMPDISGVDEGSILDKSAALTREVGELMQQVSQSVRDGAVNDDEITAMDKALMELMTAGKTLIEQAKQAGSKP